MDKLTYTQKVFDSYEKRFAKARADKILRNPIDEKDREEILKEVRNMLELDKIKKPKIEILDSSEKELNGVVVKTLLFKSWEHSYGEANLFLPSKNAKNVPVVVLCSGHGKNGRLTPEYQNLAFRLATNGIAVLLSDNLGQGSREEFVHNFSFFPICAGITLQGMIVSESNAWIDWICTQDFADKNKIGVCGNSGGGTLSMFLLATNKNVAAAASCGYPSEFSYVLQKEKRHCACNLLKGCAQSADMWEIFSAFAPKHLLLLGGKYDDLFGTDIVKRTYRKVKTMYAKMGADKNLKCELTNTKHPLELEDLKLITEFFLNTFNLEQKNDTDDIEIMEKYRMFTYPYDAATTNQIAANILGVQLNENIRPHDVFKPICDGELVDKNMLYNELFNYDAIHILAQMEFALYKE